MLHSMGSPRVKHDLATEQQQLASAENQGCPTPTPGGASGKEPACQCRKQRDSDLIPGSGRSLGGGQGNPLQYSCLENPTDRGAWQVVVHRVATSQTQRKQVNTTHTHWEAVSTYQLTTAESSIGQNLVQRPASTI